MSGIAPFFGTCWLIAGACEMHTAISHAKQYGYKARTFAAWFWLAGSLAAFVAFFASIWAKP
jgi:hypothetical protein